MDFLSANINFLKIGLTVLVMVILIGICSLILFFHKKPNLQNEIESVLIAQPFTENNDFMFFHLKNQMKTLLVKPNAGLKSTYIGLTVGVGSESDIDGFVGFTHLIEHLLFTGSRNFPEHHHIEKTVNKLQGEQNGVTKAFTTSYYFKIDSKGLDEFLQSLVDAIQNPTFSEEDILKEINNVNSEISMRMTYNKHLAYYKLLKTVGNPNSKLFQDGFSNIDASSIDVKLLREKLVDFHQKNYSSNIMTLSIISDDEFKDTRALVEKYFNSIPNLNLERSFFNTTSSYEKPLLPEVFDKMYYLQGFTEPSKMTLFFQTKSDLSNTSFKSLDYFSFFLNYFAENSFKQSLIKKNLITSMSDSIALQDYVDSIYVVSFSLTPNGLENPSEVIREFFKFVEFVRRLPDKKQTFDDLAKATKYSFLFGVKSEFMDFSEIEQNYFDRAVEFSEIIQDYSAERIFTAKNIMYGYDDDRFVDTLKDINSKNMMIMIESPQFKKKTDSIDQTKESFEVSVIEPVRVEKISTDDFIPKEETNDSKVINEDSTNTETKEEKDSESLQENHAGEDHPVSSTSPAETQIVESRTDSVKSGVQKDKPTAVTAKEERNLGLISDRNSVDKSYESPDEVLSRFFNLKESDLLSKRLSKGRLLEESLVSGIQSDVSTSPSQSRNQLDGLHHRVVLDQSFDFDNGRMYTSERVSPSFREEVEPRLSQHFPLHFDTCQSFDTTHLNHYRMVSKCRPPKSLSTLVKTESQSTAEVMSFVRKPLGDSEAVQGIRTEKLFSAIFNDGVVSMSTSERYSLLRDLLVYKLCIIEEFQDDDKQLRSKSVVSSDRLKAYHSLFRKTLQPKVVVIVAIESQSVLTSVINTRDFSQRTQKTLLMEVLCMYLMRHVEFSFRDEFLKGSDFKCSAVNFRAVLQFEGFSEYVEEFAAKILGSLDSLTQSSSFREYLISNFKQRLMHLYSQFSAIGSLKLSTFYLNLVMDKIFIDNSSEEKVAEIGTLVDRISETSLSSLMREVLTENRLVLLGVGNADEETVQRLATSARSSVPGSLLSSNHTVDFGEFRKYTFDNFVTKIEKDEHLMLRLSNVDQSESNCVYLTYFSIARMTRTVKVHALIMNHFLKKLVYDHLRNNLNLGYVTQSGLKVYYRNVGLIVLIQGEKFRPHELEGVVDDMLLLFLKAVTEIKNEELRIVKQSVLSELTEFSASLEEVAQRYFDDIEDEFIDKNEPEYSDIVETVSQTSLKLFAEEFMIKESRRLTIELFANRISEDEREFRIQRNSTLNQRDYSIVSLDDLLKRKETI